MPFHATPQTLERTQNAIRAAQTLAGRASEVARVCTNWDVGKVAVAVITPDVRFGGVWGVPKERLGERVALLPPNGWS